MRQVIAGIAFALALQTGALAQVAPPTDPTPDVPRGYPYNTAAANEASVSLRDFMSLRIDQLRAEIFRVMDERDLRYAQRFDAQNAAVTQALNSAQAAVTKAETATDTRFTGVNEFRQTLSDQALNFANKDAVEVRFKAVESSLLEITARITAIQNQSRGAYDLWLIIGGLIVIGLAVTRFVADFRKPTVK